MHRVNLDDKCNRLDLINDISTNINKKEYEVNGIKVEKSNINIDTSKRINMREGNYISILFEDITDFDSRKRVEKILIKELKCILKVNNLINKKSLIIGLGNNLSTPDSLGPKTIDNIITTRHLFIINDVSDEYSEVSKIAPGVFATTGIESFDIIKGVVDRINPDFLIVIDALKSSSIKKINKIIQITDSGINPGSGVGNQRKEISYNTIGKPVIAIGVPTVVNLHTIVKDFLEDYDIDNILNKKKENFLVTTKDIDFEIDKLSLLLSSSINKSLHNLTK
jgi:spore protease